MPRADLLVEPCQRRACELQRCLQGNDFQESRCELEINKLIHCCEHYPTSTNCAFYAPDTRKATKQYETVRERQERQFREGLEKEKALREKSEAEVRELKAELERYRAGSGGGPSKSSDTQPR
ncbi:unnamed protein product [Pedinophyceae sp. YPF-701]|nr:unnamed protein product [Pedinophyceae sp. YPF-701]